MMNVAPYGHINAAGESFKDTFYLVVFVTSFGFDMEVHTGRIAQRFEEMEEHLGRHVANLFAGEGGIPYQPGPSAEIKLNHALAVVHGQAVAVTFNASLAS